MHSCFAFSVKNFDLLPMKKPILFIYLFIYLFIWHIFTSPGLANPTDVFKIFYGERPALCKYYQA